MSKQERFCFCRLEAKGFMIMCDGCRIWFHGRCVKMSKKSSEAIEFWYCMWCNLYRDSAKSVIEEQEKIREDILKIKGELEHLKVAIKMNTGGLTSSTDSHASSDPSEQSLDQELIIVKKNLEKLKEENLVYQKNHADILTRVDSLKRELVSKQKELNSIEVNFKNYQEESLSSKRRIFKKKNNFLRKTSMKNLIRLTVKLVL
ncbi:uncharacterized protein LOC113209513 isoform X2 [Frankliniella occidentalis]|uniref:Uncharacterized protein LOC113209513 isoform X2 n=1 Tax=Frankliniella occidentalis TaxID=133901 RepID=A0A6J1SU52_FRAOC|nr:uncharacterized protein LOC113209513 isoform X2 [Frankliniella occidentalis]